MLLLTCVGTSSTMLLLLLLLLSYVDTSTTCVCITNRPDGWRRRGGRDRELEETTRLQSRADDEKGIGLRSDV